MNPRPRFRKCVYFVWAFSCCFRAAATLEVGLRLFEAATDRHASFEIFEPSPQGPCEVRANVSFSTRVGNEIVNIRTNSAGMHWREVSVDKPFDRFSDFAVSDNLLRGSYWSRVDLPPVARAAEAELLQRLAQILELVSEAGAELKLVAIPFREQVYSRHESGSGFDIRLPQKRILKQASDQGIPVCDLLQLLRKHVVRCDEQLYQQTDSHFTTRGHEVAGELVANWLGKDADGPGVPCATAEVTTVAR